MNNKSQHYVPQHYLRQFAAPGSKFRIGVATITPFRFIPGGSIKGQCAVDFYYGEDMKLERVLGATETATAPTLVDICNSGFIDSEQNAGLCLFAATLYIRNHRQNEILKLVPKLLAFEQIQFAIKSGQVPPAPEPISPDSFDLKDFPQFTFQQGAIPVFCELLTLNCKLLRCSEGRQFVTSDSPIVMLNPFSAGRSVGVGQSGIQVILPISPRICAFFFDAAVYRLSGGHSPYPINISDGDTETLNSLQVQSATNCLYFSDMPRSEVWLLINRSAKLRVPVASHLTELEWYKPKERLLKLTGSKIKLTQPWHFLKRRKNTKVKPGQRRDPAWTECVNQIMDEMPLPHGISFSKRFEELLGDSRHRR